MTLQEAKSIGGKQFLLMAGSAVVIAEIIAAYGFSSKPDWFWFLDFEFWPLFILGVLIFLGVSYRIGQWAGKLILIDGKSGWVVGPLLSLLDLFITAFLVSLPGFFIFGAEDLPNDNPFYNYIFKPMIWIIAGGWIVAIIFGLLFGYRIQKKRAVSPEANSN